MDYRKGSHTTFAIEYHFVWATKYRRKVLRGDVAERLRELGRQTCEAMEVRILSGVVSADHVYILRATRRPVSAPPQWSPSEIMRRIKGRTAKRLFDDFPRLRKQFWGRHVWVRGYFCVTSGVMTKEKIEEYLRHHFEGRGGDDNFEIE